MEDALKRIGMVEQSVAALVAIVPHLATKADLNILRADMTGDMGSLKAQMSQLEKSLIKWMIGTVLTLFALTFSVAKLVS